MLPFGRKKNSSEKGSFVKNVTKRGSFLDIESIGFSGLFTTSPSGRYTIAWCDADKASGRGGFREKGEGRYVLLDNDKVILNGKMQRPNDGHVADNGTFVINDWMFGEGTKGTFYAVDRQGSVLMRKLFRANLHNNGISPDGRFALCQTCKSDNTDSSMLSLFDLLDGEILWQKQPESGWADAYEFNLEKGFIYLVYRNLGKFAYNLLGEFLDEERWQTERIKGANGFELSAIARERFQSLDKDVDPNTCSEILSLLEGALQRGLDDYPNEQAKVYRTMGEVFEVLGERSKAAEHYERALRLNPKVGVRRKLDALKKGNA
jgi:hypothetical protein